MQNFKPLRQALLEELAMSRKKERKREEEKISACADGGPRSRAAHARPSAQPPINTIGKFSVHVSSE